LATALAESVCVCVVLDVRKVRDESDSGRCVAKKPERVSCRELPCCRWGVVLEYGRTPVEKEQTRCRPVGAELAPPRHVSFCACAAVRFEARWF
jgi:hypothetical protein